MWPEGKGKQVCIGCLGRHVRCLLGGLPVSNWPLKADGPVKKKHWVASKATIDSEDNASIVEVTSPAHVVTAPRLAVVPTEPRADWVDWVLAILGVKRTLWAIATGVGGLAEEEGDTRHLLVRELQGIQEVVEHRRDMTLDLCDEVAECVQVLTSWAHRESGAERAEVKDKGKGKEVGKGLGKDDDETLS